MIFVFNAIFLFLSVYSEFELLNGLPGSSNTSFSTYMGPGFHSNNRPGGRYLTGYTTISETSSFLFGGGGYHRSGKDDFLCDLWEYNSELNMWRFLKGGLDFGGYDKGRWSFSFDEENFPSGRRSALMFLNPFSDIRVNLFGGFPINSQLWEYDIILNRFRVVHGAYYGESYQSHEFDYLNQIPGRTEGAFWVDRNNGTFYIFGGAGYHGDYNDLWEFDLEQFLWKWVRGPNCVDNPNDAGYYGKKGVYSDKNDPPARYGAIRWMSNKRQELFLFGGLAWERFDFFNDVWSFSMISETWCWKNGENANLDNATSWSENVFSIGQTFESNNLPCQRRNSFFWGLGDESVIIYGGDKFSKKFYVFGDLWEYSNDKNMFRCLDFCGNWNSTSNREYNTTKSTMISGRTAGTSFKNNEGGILLFSGFFGVNDIWLWDNNTIIPKCRNISIYETEWLCSGHGDCENDNCVCDTIPQKDVTSNITHYIGDECETWRCFGLGRNDSNVCSGHGECNDINRCDCYTYVGDKCDQFTCFSHGVDDSSVCNFRQGECIGLDVCECKEDRYGTECQEKITTADKMGMGIKIVYEANKEMVDSDQIYDYFDCSERIWNVKILGKDPKCLWEVGDYDYALSFLNVYLGDDYNVGDGDFILVKPISTPKEEVKVLVEEDNFRFPWEIIFPILVTCAFFPCCLLFFICCFCCIIICSLSMGFCTVGTMYIKLQRQMWLFDMLDKPYLP